MNVEAYKNGTRRAGIVFSEAERNVEDSHDGFASNHWKENNNAGRFSLFTFFCSELVRGYALESDEARYVERRRKIYALLRIPRELEKFLFCGLLQCTDAFLYVFTFLPLRFLIAVGHFCQGRFGCSPSERCDVLKIIILIVSCFLVNFFDTSIMYHMVRGQAIVKLYIVFNMLEVADKLFSSFGQDILDALFWTANEPLAGGQLRSAKQRCLKLVPYLVIAIVYVWLHALLVLLQATTLNVAFNSQNKSLLTIMMSNNFVELKGSVFKKFARNNLFQMACSDVRERFHYVILLGAVFVRNMSAVSWRRDDFFDMAPDLVFVFVAELLVDWVKHAFITKFNEIPADVYKDFTITIAYDVAKSRQVNALTDHCDQVSRRMGFIPLPLSVLVFRILSQSFKIEPAKHWPTLALVFVALLLLKLLISVVMMGKSAEYIEAYEQMLQQGELLKKLCTKKARSLPASPKLSLLEFSDVMQQTQVPAGITVTDLLQKGAEWPPAPANGLHRATPTAETDLIAERVLRKSRSMTSLSSENLDEPNELLDSKIITDELQEVDRYTFSISRLADVIDWSLNVGNISHAIRPARLQHAAARHRNAPPYSQSEGNLFSADAPQNHSQSVFDANPGVRRHRIHRRQLICVNKLESVGSRWHVNGGQEGEIGELTGVVPFQKRQHRHNSTRLDHHFEFVTGCQLQLLHIFRQTRLYETTEP
ncbi:Protein TAPT1 -like protein [Trichinella nelsoni]|uniref:Protein TAPT1-like protein n=1 Tax=Trichinella nelsoni TaxID=6336 RepID=A0A0V0RQZ4_9BILA|nr:Protein TAPT1 -like protein [Trichinella nelsoni]